MNTVTRFSRSMGMRFFLVIIIAAAISAWNAGQVEAASRVFQGDAPASFADLAEKVHNSVVNISTTQVIKGGPMPPMFGPDSPFHDFFGDEFQRRFEGQPSERKANALGSGFILDESGLILTNSHVVSKASEIKVKTNLGKEYDAKVVGQDPKTDLALIKVEPDANFPRPASLGDSEAIRVGDWIIAVGNPFGLGNTVTAGIISAKGRVIGAGPYDDFLQTDVAINPGNSGGPLFDMNGEVVGISTAIVAQGQGIGFAIPINLAKQLLPQLKRGKVIRGWLGLAIQDVTPELAKALNLKKDKGALIADVVQGGPADKAGLERGDVIVGLDGKEVTSSHMLSSTVAGIEPGSKVGIDIIRNGKTQTVTTTIGTMPDEQQQAGVPRKSEEARWGIAVGNITPQIARRFGLRRGERGVIVVAVEPESPASDAGIKPGDIIKEVDRKGIGNVQEFNRAVSKAGDNLLLLVKREEGTIYVPLSRGNKEEQ